MQAEDIINCIGPNGKFQTFSFIFVSLLWTILSLIAFLPSFLFQQPTFTCGGISNMKEIDACPIITTCMIEQINTITEESKLFCEKIYIRDTIESSEFAGSICGLMILSHLADKFGRRVIMVLALVICLIGSALLVIGSHFEHLVFMSMGILMSGFGAYPLSIISFSYLSQINTQDWREHNSVFVYSFWILGEILLYPIITIITNWRLIILIIFILPLIGLMVMSYFLVESPYYLYEQRRFKQCQKCLNYISKFNNQPLIPLQIGPLDELTQVSKEDARFQKKPSLMTWEYMLPLIALCIAQYSCSGYYEMIQYSINQDGFRFEVNMLFVGSLEYISCFVTNYLCPKIRRKQTIVTILFFATFLGICNELVENQFASFIIVGLTRLSLTISLALFCVIGVEIFPASIRSRGLGIPETVANLGDMLAPFMVTLANNMNIKSAFLGGIINISGAISMLLIKQTKRDSRISMRHVQIEMTLKKEPLLDSVSQMG